MSNLTIQDRGDVVMVSFPQARILDEATIRTIGNQFEKLTLEAAANRKLLLNFKGIDFMSSAMLGQIMKLNKKCTADKIKLKLCGICPQVMEAFTITRLNKVLQIEADEEAALAAFDCQDELKGHVEVYRKNRELLLAALPALGLKTIAPPDGAFYIYADVGHLTDDSLSFCQKLLRDTGVATAPGIDFDPVEGRHFIRMSFAVSTPEVEDAISRLVPWFAEAARKA